MSNLAIVPNKNMEAVESALAKNDISKLDTAGRVAYLNALCESVGLNPLTQPFAFITLQGKETVYARKDCAEQLRKIHGVSTQIVKKGLVDGMYEVHIKAQDRYGRQDEDFAAIPARNSSGSDLANLMMKCVTKAKRRVTLSICGLGVLDESELDTINPQLISGAANPQIQSPFAKTEEPKLVTATVVDEEPKREDPKPETDLGEFICNVGQKFKGKKLSEIDQFQLDNYLKWMQKNAEEKNRPLTGEALEFYNTAEAYLCSKEVPAPEFDASELLA